MIKVLTIMRVLSVCIMFFFLISPLFSQTLELEEDWWQVNGHVNAIAIDDSSEIIYLGGDFTSIGPNLPNGVLIDKSTGQVNPNYPRPNSVVSASISDGKGGWFYAGSFTKMGDSIRNRIAHIDSNGSISPIIGKKGFNGAVFRMKLVKDRLYAAGAFTGYGEFNEFGAALNVNSGLIDLSIPSPNSKVLISLPDGNGGWFIGGEFTMVGDSVRNYLAQIDSTGKVSSWNPNLDSTVHSMALDGTKLYVGGSFTSIGGQTRNHIGSISKNIGNVLSWNPNANGDVYSIVADGNEIYVGGDFSSVGGKSRARIAKLFASNGTAFNWNPNANDKVKSIQVVGSKVFVGGNFTNIGGLYYKSIAFY